MERNVFNVETQMESKLQRIILEFSERLLRNPYNQKGSLYVKAQRQWA